MTSCNECLNENTDTEEEQRILELYKYEMLNTPREETIDSITRLTQIICGMPICLVTLLDRKKAWFKSHQGLESEEADRDISFCKYAIKQDKIFEINDTLKDPLFANNPLVTGHPNIRHYAGMPLKSSNGYNLGTLCVLDSKPGALTETQRIALETLAKQVILQFEMKKVLIELKISNERSMKLSLVKDEFLSNMSHELRTPLNAIFGFTEILQNSVNDEKQKEYLDIIKSSVEILISIINNILDFSKIELGKLVIEKKPFDLKKALKEIFELLKQKAIEKNLFLRFNISSNIPKVIVGDKVRLNQILVNLIGNAIKFTDKGKIEIQVRRIKIKESEKKKISQKIQENNNNEDNDIKYSNKFNIKEENSINDIFFKQKVYNENMITCEKKKFESYDIAELEIIVRDTGIGIKEDKLNKIFERFEQASPDITRNYGGSGLGLSISKNLVELHGGKIKVKSEFGKGSEFIFNIAYEYHKNIKNCKKPKIKKNSKILSEKFKEKVSNEDFNFSKFGDSIIYETNKIIEEIGYNNLKNKRLKEKISLNNEEKNHLNVKNINNQFYEKKEK